jgi:hypothetical protein
MAELFDDDGPAYMEIVEDLLDGKATFKHHGAWYWYAIEQIIADLGRRLSNGSWYPGNSEPFWSHASCCMNDIDSPMQIPAPDDFPSVFVIRNSALSDELVVDFREKISDEDQFSEFSRWVKEAQRYKQDLVMFYY